MDSLVQTIAAVSTAPGVAGIAVVRVSGPLAGLALEALAGRLPAQRLATLAAFVHPVSRETLDVGLCLWFPGPHSFTGDDLAEFHVHGGRAVVAGIVSALLAIPGIRPAEAGEFTRRAFENGKLDLAAVEGLSDLLAAETQAQRRQAVAQYQGRIGSVTEPLAARLKQALALVEASIDFSDEGDISTGVAAEARHLIVELAAAIKALLADSERGERIRDGITVAIAGPPNAGKSTLLNALAGRDVAIVSPVAGTTRDVLEVHLDLGGMAVVLLDMAGLRDSADLVEAEGIRRARDRLTHADLVLWLSADDSGGEARPPPSAPIWRIRTHADVNPASSAGGPYDHTISVPTGEGLSPLIDDLSRFAAGLAGGEPAILVRERHRQTFCDALAHCNAALALPDWDASAEVVAEELRLAGHAFGRAIGRFGSEAVLDVIFSSFCIGK